MNLSQRILVLALQAYRWILSPLKLSVFGPLARCRFTPSCSQYAMEAIEAHGAWCGTALAIRRLCRCHPWGGCGHDPVPPSRELLRACRRRAEMKVGRSFSGILRRNKV
jgi:putative membrane protein insertion efficiency factor